MIEGRVVNVTEVRAGTELEEAATAADETLTVVDVEDLDLDGGTLQIGEEVITYTVPEPDEETLLVPGEVYLDTPLDESYDAETPVYVYPAALERFAYVMPRDHEEPILARVPHALYALLEVGARPDDDTAETALLDLADDEYVVDDLLDEEPSIDGGFLTVGTVSAGDGNPPAASPTPAVTGGPGYLLLEWEPVENTDLVVYEVYLSDTDAFTPTEAELVGEVAGTAYVATVLGDGTPLAFDTTYYARLIARDVDGAAAPGTQGSGSMARLDIPAIEPIEFGDLEGTIEAAQIAALTITGAMIAANTITAGKVAANTLTASEIAAGAIEATEIASGAVTTAKLAAAAVTANEVAAGAITAVKINVTDLSAISVSAGTITSGTFRGTIFETSATDPKVRLDTTGLFATDASANEVVKVTTNGLQIKAGTTGSPPNERQIRWLDGSDVTTRLLSSATTPGGSTQASGAVESNPGRARQRGDLILQSLSTTDAAYLQVYAQDGASYVGVQANPSGTFRALLRGDNTSDWVFKTEGVRALADTAAPLKVIRGTVNTVGPATVVGSGFTLTRNGVGDLTINFTSAFSAAPSVSLGMGVTLGDLAVKHLAAPTTSASRILVFDTSAATAAEGIFSFIAIGPA